MLKPDPRKVETKQRDRGDNVRKIIKIPNKKKMDCVTQVEIDNLDRGEPTTNFESKRKIEENNVKNARVTRNFSYEQTSKVESNPTRPLTSTMRRHIHQMYTFRLKSTDNTEAEKPQAQSKNRVRGNKIEVSVTPQTEYHPKEPTTIGDSESVKSLKAQPQRKRRVVTPKGRKPIIKTVTQNGFKVYKSVCFVEQTEAKPLNIKISRNDPRSQETSSKSSSHKTSQESSKIDCTKCRLNNSRNSSISKLVLNRRVKNKNRRRNSSPETQITALPVAEAATWDPQCITEDTKPYYEAWVNTTLAAVNNDREKAKKEKESIIKRMIERQAACKLTESDLKDERCTGRIRVHRR